MSTSLRPTVDWASVRAHGRRAVIFSILDSVIAGKRISYGGMGESAAGALLMFLLRAPDPMDQRLSGIPGGIADGLVLLDIGSHGGSEHVKTPCVTGVQFLQVDD